MHSLNPIPLVCVTRYPDVPPHLLGIHLLRRSGIPAYFPHIPSRSSYLPGAEEEAFWRHVFTRLHPLFSLCYGFPLDVSHAAGHRTGPAVCASHGPFRGHRSSRFGYRNTHGCNCNHFYSLYGRLGRRKKHLLLLLLFACLLFWFAIYLEGRTDIADFWVGETEGRMVHGGGGRGESRW